MIYVSINIYRVYTYICPCVRHNAVCTASDHDISSSLDPCEAIGSTIIEFSTTLACTRMLMIRRLRCLMTRKRERTKGPSQQQGSKMLWN